MERIKFDKKIDTVKKILKSVNKEHEFCCPKNCMDKTMHPFYQVCTFDNNRIQCVNGNLSIEFLGEEKDGKIKYFETYLTPLYKLHVSLFDTIIIDDNLNYIILKNK